MKQKIFISAAPSIYAIDNVGIVLSTLKEDTLIEGALLPSIFSLLAKTPSSTEELLAQLNTQFSPAKIVGTTQQLIAMKLLGFEATTVIKNDAEHDFIKAQLKKLFTQAIGQLALSTTFFENIVTQNTEDNVTHVNLSDNQILIPPATGLCASCINARILSHRPLLKFAAENKDNTQFISRYRADKPARERLQDLVKKYEGALDPHFFWDIDLITNTATSFEVQPKGSCDLCNTSNTMTSNFHKDIRALKTTRTQGFRVRTLEETYQSLLPLVHPIVGVISKLEPYRSLENELVCNYSSGRNLAFSSTNRFWLNNHLRSSSGGKGKTALQAKVGALCEGVERYSMVHQGQQPDITAPYNPEDDAFIHPHACLNFSPDQYINRGAINATVKSFHQLVPQPFDESTPQHWSKAYSLTRDKPCFILSEIAYAQYSDKNEETFFAYPDSNGCAAGNTHLEAILQGTLELIERDAAAIWWYNRCERPHMDIESIGNTYINEVRDYYSELNRAFHILDITTDLETPCFVAVSYNQKTQTEILYAFGCHVDPNIAIERCVIELNQLLPVAMTQRSSNSDQTLYTWMDTQSIEAHPHLNANQPTALNFKTAYPDKIEFLEQAIQTLTGRLAEQSIELIAFDLTQRDTQLPVVRMLAPGLRHFWRRTGPGRLFDVPERLGWVESVLTEEQLNPHSITI